MNHRTTLAENSAPSASTVDFQDVCSLGMDQAIGIENPSLDIKQKTSWFSPVGKLFKAAAQALGFCMEMQRSWLSVVAPHATSRVSTVASNSSSQSPASPDDLAYSMDIAIGPQQVAVRASMAACSSVRIAQPQPTPDELAYSMDIAIGERFTALSSAVVSSSVSQAPTAEPEVKGLAMAAKAGN